MTMWHRLGVAALIFCTSPVVFGDLIITVGDLTLTAGQTGQVDVFVTNGDLANDEAIAFADYGFFITPQGSPGSTLEFTAVDIDINLPTFGFESDPNYLFAGASGFVDFDRPASDPDFYIGTDEANNDDFEVILPAGETRLLVSLDVTSVLGMGTAPTSLSPDVFAIEVSMGTEFQNNDIDNFEIDVDFDSSVVGFVTVVPEPSSLAALVILGGSAVLRRRRK